VPLRRGKRSLQILLIFAPFNLGLLAFGRHEPRSTLNKLRALTRLKRFTPFEKVQMNG
jgi:hypothetical protein